MATPTPEQYERMKPWLEEMLRQLSVECVPTIPVDEINDADSEKSGSVYDGFFEKRIKRISGGPPPRGKPKPPVEDPPPVSGEAALAIHRAMTAGRR